MTNPHSIAQNQALDALTEIDSHHLIGARIELADKIAGRPSIEQRVHEAMRLLGEVATDDRFGVVLDDIKAAILAAYDPAHVAENLRAGIRVAAAE